MPATGEVRTPANPQPPQGHMWDLVTKAKTPEQLKKLDDQVAKQGYAKDGQLRQAIHERLKKHSPTKKKGR